MKTNRIMARMLAALLMLTATATTPARAGWDKEMTMEQLPEAARQTLKKHFGQRKVAMAKMERDWWWKSYDVILTDGSKLEFDSKGQWTSIDCKRSRVPLALVPQALAKKMRELYPGAIIIELERDRKGYEVKLNNGIEIELNKNLVVTDIDD